MSSAKPQRYAFMDGIRGIAAILVLTRHTLSFWSHEYFRSYLAVDLFFVLSGFVIAHAYDERLATRAMSVREFMLVRIIRLYPVYVLSAVLCGVLVVARTLFGSHGSQDHGVGLAMNVLLPLAMLPSASRGSSFLFPTNTPYWSLFFEVVVNLVYALVRRFLTNARLLAMVTVSGAVVAVLGFRHGNLDVGWEWGLESILAGFFRATFGIFLGLWLFRRRDALVRGVVRAVSPWLAFVVVCAALMSPGAGRWDAPIDLLLVVAVFPFAVLVFSQRTQTRFERPLLILGSASYPIYVFHSPLASMVSAVVKHREHAYAPFSGLVLVALLIAFSVVLEKRFDIPVRRWLSRILVKHPRAQAAETAPDVADRALAR